MDLKGVEAAVKLRHVEILENRELRGDYLKGHGSPCTDVAFLHQ